MYIATKRKEIEICCSLPKLLKLLSMVEWAKNHIFYQFLPFLKKKKKRKKGGAIFWCPRLKTSFCHSYKKVVLRGMFYFSANISNWWQNEVCFANMKCLFFSPTHFFFAKWYTFAKFWLEQITLLKCYAKGNFRFP